MNQSFQKFRNLFLISCKKKLIDAVLILLVLCVFSSNAHAQRGVRPISIFGYFQNSFQQWTAFENQPKLNSFSLQQLNLFFQKNLGNDWTAFVNFEFLNNYSSIRQWGAFNLEEAWVKYRADKRFNLKIGALIPIFNNLNEIKNRTPLLPYIVRPLAYETSFSEFFPVEIIVPSRAFAQVYGFFPVGRGKLDYAVYLGNSPNINDNPFVGQTGVDTTSTFLVGGRIGIRFREWKLGLSATYDKDNFFEYLAPALGMSRLEFNELPKTRLGGDLSYNYENFSIKSEFILVDIKKDFPGIKANLDFYYVTAGYHLTEKLFAYGSYWLIVDKQELVSQNYKFRKDEDISVYSLGGSYNLADRVALKAQFSKIFGDEKSYPDLQSNAISKDHSFSVFALAVSVLF